MCEGVESYNGSGGGSGGDDTPTTTPTGYKVGATQAHLPCLTTRTTHCAQGTDLPTDCVVSFHVNISGKTSGNTSKRIMRLLTKTTAPG